MANNKFRNMKIGRKYPVENHMIDLTNLKWSKENDLGRPHQITLMIIHEPDNNAVAIYPYERYIRSTVDHKRKNEDMKHCENCSHLQVCPNYGKGKCPGFNPTPRESIIVTQESGYAWVIFNTRDLQMGRVAEMKSCLNCIKEENDDGVQCPLLTKILPDDCCSKDMDIVLQKIAGKCNSYEPEKGNG